MSIGCSLLQAAARVFSSSNPFVERIFASRSASDFQPAAGTLITMPFEPWTRTELMTLPFG
eukprot:4549089-Prymnesium_polylepis.1